MALPVVLPMHQQVNNSKDCLLIDPRVSGQETVDILTWIQERKSKLKFIDAK